MKCGKCNSEWNTSSSISVSLTTCPFCGERLHTSNENFTSEYEVLRYLYARFGIEFLRNGQRVLAYFADLAPMLKREKRILSYFIECNGHIQIIDSLSSTTVEQQLAIKRIVQQMTDDLSVAESVSCKIATTFLNAISSQPEDIAVPQPSPSIEPTSENISAPSPKSPSAVILPGYEDFQVSEGTLVKYLGNKTIVDVPKEIQIIGEKAFYGNTTIAEVRLPDNIQKIEEYAFAFCTCLQSINMPEGLTKLGDYAFSGSGIKRVKLPSSLSILGNGVFFLSDIQQAIVPGTIKSVPTSTFESCASLIEVVLCDGVSELGAQALDYCPSLRTITIPDTLDHILTSPLRPFAFIGTDNIQVINASMQWKKAHRHDCLEMIPAENEADNYFVKDNVLVRYYGRAARPVIPADVTSIGPQAFYHNPYILEMVIPEGVQQIGKSAFSLCINLRVLALPSTLSEIERCAFSHTSLSSLSLPSGVQKVGAFAFAPCKQLKEISFPDSLSTVSSSAFSGCNNIKNIQASKPWTQKNDALIMQLLKKPTTIVGKSKDNAL